MRRRTKLFLQRLAILVGIIAIAVVIVVFFKPKKTIQTTDGNNTRKTVVRTIEDSQPMNITLPENIVAKEDNPNITTNTTSSPSSDGDKQYTPITSKNDTYFIPLQSTDTEFSLLIGYDSEKLVAGTPIEVSKEYPVKGMPEKIRTMFFFKIDDYNYPILLVLGESRKLYYVDIEESYTTGNFTIKGPIKNIPEVEEVNPVTITKDGKEYVGAVITCTNKEGYEFDISMIGK